MRCGAHLQATLAAAVQSYAQVADGLLAYKFEYPTALRGEPLPVIQSRRPERYSSAAPLTADARQAWSRGQPALHVCPYVLY